MLDKSADISGAIAALTSTLESMEQRQDVLAKEVITAKQGRRERLDQRVATLLPDISSGSLERLKQEVLSFAADSKVVTAFERNRKIFWLFKPSGYEQALVLLQAQLKLYLERQGFVRIDDYVIEKLESQKSALAVQQSEALSMLKMLKKTLGSKAELAPEAVSSINRLAQRGRQFNDISPEFPLLGQLDSDVSESLRQG